MSTLRLCALFLISFLNFLLLTLLLLEDGNQISLDPTAGTTTEVAETFDRYSRILKLKQDVAED